MHQSIVRLFYIGNTTVGYIYLRFFPGVHTYGRQKAGCTFNSSVIGGEQSNITIFLPAPGRMLPVVNTSSQVKCGSIMETNV